MFPPELRIGVRIYFHFKIGDAYIVGKQWLPILVHFSFSSSKISVRMFFYVIDSSNHFSTGKILMYHPSVDNPIGKSLLIGFTGKISSGRRIKILRSGIVQFSPIFSLEFYIFYRSNTSVLKSLLVIFTGSFFRFGSIWIFIPSPAKIGSVFFVSRDEVDFVGSVGVFRHIIRIDYHTRSISRILVIIVSDNTSVSVFISLIVIEIAVVVHHLKTVLTVALLVTKFIFSRLSWCFPRVGQNIFSKYIRTPGIVCITSPSITSVRTASILRIKTPEFLIVYRISHIFIGCISTTTVVKIFSKIIGSNISSHISKS